MGYWKNIGIGGVSASNPLVDIEFTGFESLNEILEKLPSKYAKKPVVSTFRKAAKPFTRELRRNTPKKTGETRKAIGVMPGKGRFNSSIKVGFRTKGKYLSPWFIAYWQNHGTLNRRSKGHTFRRGLRCKTSHWTSGVKAKGFVERSWEKAKNECMKIAESEMLNETKKFLQKHAV